MTASELIEKLKEMEPDTLVAAYDGGIHGDLRWPSFEVVRLKKGYGTGEPFRVWELDGETDGQPAVIL